MSSVCYALLCKERKLYFYSSSLYNYSFNNDVNCNHRSNVVNTINMLYYNIKCKSHACSQCPEHNATIILYSIQAEMIKICCTICCCFKYKYKNSSDCKLYKKAIPIHRL